MESRELSLEEARLAALAGDFLRSHRIIEAHLQANPNDTLALLLKGNVLEYEVCKANSDSPNCSREHASIQSAKACYERILELEPSNSCALLDLAEVFQDAGDYAESAALLRVALPIVRAEGDPEIIREVEVNLRTVSRLAIATRRSYLRRKTRGFAKRTKDCED